MTLRRGWLPWVSGRFLTGRRGGRGRLVFILAVVLIGSGVSTLNTILAVMNGLQQGYIHSILEIGSYHLRWTPDGKGGEVADADELIGIFESDPRVVLAVPFREGQTMLSGQRPRPAGALVRGVPENLYTVDERLAEFLSVADGSFDISGRGIVLGDELAMDLGVAPGDEVTAMDLGSAGMVPAERSLTVTGLFRCDYDEYEAAMAFVSLETSEEFFGATPVEIGVKLRNVERDAAVTRHLLPRLEGSGGTLMSWRVVNRSFFGALRTEKMAMLLLLGLIFVVVAVNIDHSLRRMATERVEDLSILKALGASPRDIRLLFIRYGLLIGGSGGVVGSIFGVLIGANVSEIINAFYGVIALFSAVFGAVSGTGFGSVGGNPLAGFLGKSEVMAGDVLVIFLLAVVLSLLSAVRAAGMAARSKPAEVLRSE